eukprot:GFUD01016876.1.p1 GENE.GFUD01016876.1~~GFUD01016876.1.p1  ORF type:complete len:430 (+),score=113.03 GFUD01016876.1:921-2210(+)
MDKPDIGTLIEAIQNTPSPTSLLRHYPEIGLPHYWYEAVGRHDPPYSEEEENAVIEAKKSDPPAADEVFEKIFLGNKGAAENADFLVMKGISHVLNLAADTNLKFFVVPDRERLEKNGIELKEMQLKDRKGENISEKFRESGMWIRSSLAAGGTVMVNCWQGASRSATIVLAYLIQHHKMPLEEAIKTVKSRRDIRPNNGFLNQLLILEEQLLHGLNGNLVDLYSEKGQILLKESKAEGLSKFDEIEQIFGKQSWRSFCGVQSCCIVLNALQCSPSGKTLDGLFLETDFWSYDMSKVLDESVVRKQGMTLAQCTSLLANVPGITANSQRTDQSSFAEFQEHVECVMATKQKQMIINYNMEALGQLAGLRGHISPLAAYSRSGSLALLMDVWPETRECWVTLEDIWRAMDTLDAASNPPTMRGFIIVSKD